MPLRGSLATTTLRACRDDIVNLYTSTSYVERDPTPADNLNIDKTHEELRVATNLTTALRNIRHASQVLKLWIEVLCINQTDLTERARQVRLMGEFYTGAGSTLIYLGPPKPGLEALYEAALAKTYERFGLQVESDGPATRSEETEEQIKNGREEEEEIEDEEVQEQRAKGANNVEGLHATLANAIAGFLSYAWFSRAWMFQELVLFQTKLEPYPVPSPRLASTCITFP